jgi:TP901-1 family phage major tail protein
MSIKKGLECVIKIDTSATATPNFVTVGGIQSKGIDSQKTGTDVTNYDSPGRWREILPGTGPREVNISGSGVLKDGPGMDKLIEVHEAGTLANMQIIWPGRGTYVGPFSVPKLSIKPKHDGEIPFDVDLESAGALTFTAET